MYITQFIDSFRYIVETYLYLLTSEVFTTFSMESENESCSQGQNTDSSVVVGIQEEEEIVTFEADKVFSKKLDRNRSLIWNFFAFKGKRGLGPIGQETKEVFCNICSKELKYSGATSNLWDHVKRSHENELKAVEDKKNKKIPDIRDWTLPNLSNNNTKTWKKSSVKWKKATELLAKWTCLNTRPFSIVNDEGFIAFIKFIAPEYELPSHTTIVNYIQNLYDEEKQKLQDELKDVAFCAVTTDGGSSSNATSFQDINVHYLDKDLELKSKVLSVQEIKEEHTAVNVRHANDEVLEEFGILDKVSLTVTDNEPKMNLCYPSFERSGCLCHIEHSSISKGVEKNDEVYSVIQKIRKVSTKHNKSHRFKNILETEQKKLGLKQRPLIQDVVNRWGSTKAAFGSYLTHPDDLNEHGLFDNLMAVNNAIKKAVKRKFHDSLIISASEMNVIEHVHDLFTKLDVYTTTLGGSKFVTSSIVFPVMRSMESVLKPNDADPDFIAELKEEIFSQFTKRCEDNLNYSVLSKCSVLDPRFRKLKFIHDIDLREQVFQGLLQEMKDLVTHQLPTDGPDTCDGLSSPLKTRKLGLCYEESDDDEMEDCTVEDKMKAELDMYMKEKVLGQEFDPLDWWRANKLKYPTLVLLVRKYLCIPASSTQAERVFSKLGLLLNKKRLCMSTSNVDKVLFVSDKI